MLVAVFPSSSLSDAYEGACLLDVESPRDMGGPCERTAEGTSCCRLVEELLSIGNVDVVDTLNGADGAIEGARAVAAD